MNQRSANTRRAHTQPNLYRLAHHPTLLQYSKVSVSEICDVNQLAFGTFDPADWPPRPAFSSSCPRQLALSDSTGMLKLRIEGGALQIPVGG